MRITESQLRHVVRSLLRESSSSSLLPPGVTHEFFVAWYRRVGTSRFPVNVPNVTNRLISVGFSPEDAAELATLASECLDPSYPVPTTTMQRSKNTIITGLKLGPRAAKEIERVIECTNFNTYYAMLFVTCFNSTQANRERPNVPMDPGRDSTYSLAHMYVKHGFPKIRREDMERQMDFVETVSAFEEQKDVPVKNLQRLLLNGVDGIMQAAELYRSL